MDYIFNFQPRGTLVSIGGMLNIVHFSRSHFGSSSLTVLSIVLGLTSTPRRLYCKPSVRLQVDCGYDESSGTGGQKQGISNLFPTPSKS